MTPTIDNSAIQLLSTLNGGACASEMAEKLREASKAAGDQRKKARLTIEIEIAPGKSGAAEVSYKISSKVPRAEADPAFYFICEDGSLSRKDPRQRELEFKAVEGGQASPEPETRN